MDKMLRNLRPVYRKPLNRILTGFLLWIIGNLAIASTDPILMRFYLELGFYIGMIFSGLLFFIFLSIINYIDKPR